MAISMYPRTRMVSLCQYSDYQLSFCHALLEEIQEEWESTGRISIELYSVGTVPLFKNNVGLCRALAHKIKDYDPALFIANWGITPFKVLSEHWPKRSESFMCPVPSTTKGQHPVDAYYNLKKDDLNSKYGKLRMELLVFAIAELNEEINRRQAIASPNLAEDNESLLKALLEARDMVAKPPYPDRGLCSLISCDTYLDSTFHKYVIYWEKASGNALFPVPDKELSPWKAYRMLPKYNRNTYYGKRRHELLAHLIACAEATRQIHYSNNRS